MQGTNIARVTSGTVFIKHKTLQKVACVNITLSVLPGMLEIIDGENGYTPLTSFTVSSSLSSLKVSTDVSNFRFTTSGSLDSFLGKRGDQLPSLCSVTSLELKFSCSISWK